MRHLKCFGVWLGVMLVFISAALVVAGFVYLIEFMRDSIGPAYTVLVVVLGVLGVVAAGIAAERCAKD